MSLTTSVSKTIRSLHARKFREKLGLALVEGSRLVRSAIDSGQAPVYVVSASSHQVAGSISAWVKNHGSSAIFFVVTDSEFSELSDVETAQGILAVVRTTWVPETEALTANSVVALDGIQDPGNAGAIIRSAAWYGVEAVVAGPGTVDLFSPKVLRASMGGIWDLKVVRCPLPAFLEGFRAKSGAIYAAQMDGESHRTWQPADRAVLILGNEGNGLSADVAALSPVPITIQPAGIGRGVESLNVSVAAGILIDQWRSASTKL